MAMILGRGIPLLALITLLGVSSPAHAESGILDNPIDAIWVAIAAALVFFMQAGFSLLEGGFARAKNSTNVIMKNFADVCFGVLAFWTVGFGLMFGSNPSGWFGTDHFMPASVTGGEAIFLLYQAMFAATAATIVSGAVAERMRFFPYVTGAVLITSLIYPVFGSWVWGSLYEGSGWLAEMGFIDFAGSTVVHSVGAWCALAAVMVLGPRLGRFAADGTPRTIPGHNLPMIALGVFILWLGWFGFNGGSTLAADASIGGVLLNTNLAACAGFVGSALAMRISGRPVLMTVCVNGVLAGLVGITAGAASMSAPFAMLSGLIAGLLAVWSARWLERMRIDDVVGAIPVHGFCGAWGTLAAGLFHVDGLFDPMRVMVQVVGISVAFLWAFGTAWLVFFLLSRSIGLRAETVHEQRGLDFTEHYEIGYPEFQRDITHAGKG
jgi:Amt family ammonium transporter